MDFSLGSLVSERKKGRGRWMSGPATVPLVRSTRFQKRKNPARQSITRSPARRVHSEMGWG